MTSKLFLIGMVSIAFVAGIFIATEYEFNPQPAYAGGLDHYLGQIMWVPFNFAPRGWADCDGQLLPISEHSALFSLLGTIYGGDGRTTFALPDLRGRVMIDDGNGPGLTNRVLGSKIGQETVSLTPQQAALHASPVVDMDNNGALTSGSAAVIGDSGSAHNNIQPSQTLKCVIALDGVFPSRS